MKRKSKYIEQKAFNKIKHIVDHNNLLSYTYLSKQFYIQTNDSALQQGEGLSQ